MSETAITLEEKIREIMGLLEQKYIYRKLGVCYDYASPPDEFPRKTLPTAAEARAGKPNAAGLGTGMADSTRNHALIFDGYLLRLELGIGDSEQERIFDRLIGGLIRIATAAPKGFLVRGLTPDGRGFYAQSSLEAHLFWAFAAWRAWRTAAIAQESQGKIQNIVSRWLSRLQQDRYCIRPLGGGQVPGIELTARDTMSGTVLLALLAMGGDITGQAKWREQYLQMFEADGCARLGWNLAESEVSPRVLLALQTALHVILQLDDDEGRSGLVREKMRLLASCAAGFVDRYSGCKEQILSENPDLDWRSLKGDEDSVSMPVFAGKAFSIPLTWRRLLHEAETVQAAADAALVLLLTGDRELVEMHADEIRGCILRVPWDKLWLAGALAPVPAVHARGVELGLWEEELLQREFVLANMDNLVAAYLEDDFDDQNPSRAGHTEAPPRKAKDRPRRSGNRKRRTRQPSRGGKSRAESRAPGRRRRRRKS